jgi:uncharacterized protein
MPTKSNKEQGGRSMKILISGASGLVGTALIPTLTSKGHSVVRLVRQRPKEADEIRWDSEKGFSFGEEHKLEGFDAVIHLAGDNVASGSWTDEKKRSIRESRTVGTKHLIDALKTLKSKPKIFISASATGFYGSRGDEILNEESPKGKGFLPDVCDDWENEAREAGSFARIVMLRIGVVLAKNGGALDKMLTPFKFGVGGVVGSGKQWMSWITLDDVIGIIHYALEKPLRGVYNTTTPTAATNYVFTKSLGSALNRPTFFPIPEFAVKMMFGEMGETLLLQGCRVMPKRLMEMGYKFKFPNLDEALKHVLK